MQLKVGNIIFLFRNKKDYDHLIITYIYIQLISPSDKIDCKKKLHAPKFLQTPRMQILNKFKNRAYPEERRVKGRRKGNDSRESWHA